MSSAEISIEVPRINPNDDEVLLVDLLVRKEETVQKNQVIAVLESTKATFEVIAPYNGKIANIFGVLGSMVKVGANLFDIIVDTEEITIVESEDTITKNSMRKEQKIDNSNKKKKKKLREKLDFETKSRDLVKPYLKNYIGEYKEVEHGENCYIGWNVSLTNVKLGDQVWINRDTNIYSNNNSKPVVIGSGSYVGPYVWIEGHGGVEIGECVHITGPSTCLYSHSGMKIALQGEYVSNPSFKKRESKHYFEQSIKIGNNVWIGPNCTVFPGVIISDNVVILPNTLVKSGKINSYSLVHPDGKIEKDSAFVKNLCSKKS